MCVGRLWSAEAMKDITDPADESGSLIYYVSHLELNTSTLDTNKSRSNFTSISVRTPRCLLICTFCINTSPDTDGSGTNEACVSETIGSERLSLATPWFKENGKKAILGETAGGSNPTCIAALKNELQHIADNSDVWAGQLLWAAGPWWGDCKLTACR